MSVRALTCCRYLQILSEVWLRRNVICRRSRLQELDMHYEIDHVDSKRRRQRGRLTKAYDEMRTHPGYILSLIHI